MASPITPSPTTAPHPCIHLDSPTLHALLAPHLLIPHFRATLPVFSSSIHSPPRLSYPLPSSPSSSNALLLMPCWSSDPSLPYLALKTVTVFPSNSSLSPPLPGIHAAVSLFHSLTGAPLASLDGTSLTFLRTSAVSGLASSLLSLPLPETLLIIGSGGLAKYLIAAHRSARPSIRRVFIWNRTASKALDLVHELQNKEPDQSHTVIFHYDEDLDKVIAIADIVSCATGSTTPIVKGKLLKPGAHLDLVGSFTPSMKECDDETLLRGRVFVDFEAAMDEAGELVGAFERGVLRREDVAGTLTELAAGKKEGRKRDDDEVTVFKSVGTAVVDLLAAQLAYESSIKQ